MPPSSSQPAPQAGDNTAATFRAAMRQLAGAVSVITIGRGEDCTGFTATSVASLSADVPSVLVSLNRSSSSWPVLQRHGAFCINVLAAGQQHVAEAFAGRDGRQGAARYEGALWQPLATGTAGLAGALAVIDCSLKEAIGHASHMILIGHVEAIRLGTAQEDPLLYWQGGFRRLHGA